MDDDLYCQVCQRSDPRGRKHIYSKKHKERLNAVLRKFETKVKPAKDCNISGPVVSKCTDRTEAIEKFWCPFCSAEVVKHERQGQFLVQFKSWVEHLCSAEHHKKVHTLFWTNKLDMKRRDKYKLGQEFLELFQSQTEKKIDKVRIEAQKAVLEVLYDLCLKAHEAVLEEASRIREVEQRRSTLQAASSPFQRKAEEEIQGIDPWLHPMGDKRGNFPAGVRYRNNSLCRLSAPQKGNIVGSVPYLSSVRSSKEFDGSSVSLPSQHQFQLLPVEVTSAMSQDKPTASTTPSGPAFSTHHRESQIFVGIGMESSLPGPSNFPSISTSRMSPASTTCHLPTSLALGNHSFENKAGPSLPDWHKSEVDPLQKMKTLKVVNSGGLTVISRKKSGLKGNVHSNSAVPPWLHNEDEESKESQDSLAEVGPTAEDFQKHLEGERKRKLNPRRVGANFDHCSETSDDWLPSFGRVWNHGPRWRSRSGMLSLLYGGQKGTCEM